MQVPPGCSDDIGIVHVVRHSRWKFNSQPAATNFKHDDHGSFLVEAGPSWLSLDPDHVDAKRIRVIIHVFTHRFGSHPRW
ncbi:hypothetical protein P7D22_21485 [Lichenihabitans sp. Uapishka_5]|uniref:hypothetical protein n=1 Tax=Lichenihabitans sp. Uapishka_5 TaxID=3037302 RepID=UPI0029E7FB9C|nr:hypothetical protein [Lichenihabitans sp. Uapishka_5]MDX7953741.1 hypothetical protein [Lichenihabitans sp. Uapishka_5]